MKGEHRIVLASGSPRRRELMAREGFEFEVISSDAAESYNEGLYPPQVARHLAHLKAKAVYDGLPRAEQERCIVIGADTIVVHKGEIFGKPKDAADAQRMLKELSGDKHEVITGVCIIGTDGSETFADETQVFFRQLSDEEIMAYVATGEPLDKAGAYGIQAGGAAFVDHIEGDFDNVVGLPVKRLKARLEKL